MKLNYHKYLKIIPLIVHIIISILLILIILKYNGIENIWRYIIVLSLIILNIFLIFKIIKNEDKGKLIIIIFGIILSILIQFSIYTLMNKTYDTLNKLNKKEIEYSSSLITLKKSNIQKITDIKEKKIAILNDKENIEGYIIPQQIIKDNNLKNNIFVEYDNPISMLNDLYDEKIDCAFMSSNYSIMYTSNLEKFQNIKKETKVIITKKKKYQKKETSINKQITKPFSLLIMGVDSEKDNIHTNTTFNGDALLLMTFNPNTLNATIFSIPRDTYVPIACFKNNRENKITHAAWYGEDCMIKTITNFTGINIDYYIKINFKGVVDLVNAIGGINVDVPINFCEQNSDRQFGDKTICLEKKEKILNGEEALALARHRHTINDIERTLNQQLVINGILNQLKNISNLEQIYKILDTIEKNIDTNLSVNQILSFYNIGKDIIKTTKNNNNIINVKRLYLTGYDAMIYDEEMKLVLYNYIYYKNSLQECVKAMKENLGLEDMPIIKTFNFSINSPYEQPQIGKVTGSSDKVIKTVPNFMINSKAYALEWGLKNDIIINFEVIDSYDSNYSQNQIISQSIPYGYQLSSLKNKTIILKVINKIENNTNNEQKIDCSTYSNKPVCLVPNMSTWTLNDLQQWKQSLPQYNLSIIVNIDIRDPLPEEIEFAGKVLEKDKNDGTFLGDIDEINIVYLNELKKITE